MVAAVPLKYAFYHADGNGRDSFIQHVSQHQNSNFNYVPKAPEMAGNKQAGMASGLPDHYMQEPVEGKTAQVVGYTGHFPGDRYSIGETFQHSSQHLMDTFRAHQAAGGPPAEPIHFPDMFPRPAPQQSAEYNNALAQHTARLNLTSHRIPGYGGHSSGHQHAAGFTYGAISAGEVAPSTVVIGEGAPGLGRVSSVSVVPPNLQPGAAPAVHEPRTKPGYSGHVPGRHFSSNFGKNFSVAAKEMLETHGQPPAGGVSDPGQPFNGDIGATLQFPLGHVGRPARCVAHVAGYKGFRPQATPYDLIPGGR